MELLRRRSKAHRFHHPSIMGNGQSLGPLGLDHRSARQYQGGAQNCPSQKSGPLERLDGIAQNNCIASQNDAVVGSLYHHIEIRQELRNFDRGRIRDEYNILMPHLEFCCQKKPPGSRKLMLKITGMSSPLNLVTSTPSNSATSRGSRQ